MIISVRAYEVGNNFYRNWIIRDEESVGFLRHIIFKSFTFATYSLSKSYQQMNSKNHNAEWIVSFSTINQDNAVSACTY